MTQNEYKNHPGFMAFRGSNTKVELGETEKQDKQAAEETANKDEE